MIYNLKAENFKENKILELDVFPRMNRIVKGSSYILESKTDSLIIDVSSQKSIPNIFQTGLKQMFISESGKSRIMLFKE